MSIYTFAGDFAEDLKNFPTPDIPEDATYSLGALPGKLNTFYGKTHTLESIQKIKDANIGRKDSDETRLKKSEANQGSKNSNYGGRYGMRGKTHSSATRAAQSAGAMKRERVTCKHCQKDFSINIVNRWHNDNCKNKTVDI
tara:strand:- start:1567 stop:1989 length:423 start_codon:yes stop_codon:yes gene_type:complete